MGLGRCGSRTSSVSTRCHPQHCLDCASDGSAHLGLLLGLVLSHLPSSSLSSSHSDRMTVLLHVVCLLAGCHCHHGHPRCLCPTLHCLSLSLLEEGCFLCFCISHLGFLSRRRLPLPFTHCMCNSDPPWPQRAGTKK